MRPAQIDAWGWTNNVQIGREGGRRIRLPGAAGIPDATSVSGRVFYYVPRHTSDVFVKQLDHISGVGNLKPGQKSPAHTPKTIVVVTELCVMTSDAQGALDVVSLHPGVTRDQVQEATGFTLPWQLPLQETVPPTPEQIRLLNEVVDPQGLRFLESLSGRDRRQRLRALVRREATGTSVKQEVRP
jgi:acyl CoA:acetate/3-ketoacid CoA transferase beta subunit